MSSVTTSQDAVNVLQPHTIDAVIGWVEKQTKKKDMPESSGRLTLTGLRAIAEQVAEDEPNNVEWISDNIDLLLQRWIRSKPEMKSDTAKTYASRARSAIKEFLRWDSDPAAYRPKPTPFVGARAEKKSPPPAAKPAQIAIAPDASPVVSAPKPESPPSPVAIGSEHVRKAQPGDLRECPLGGDRSFQYLPPQGGLKLKEALRIAFHLFTICDDYDPMVSPAQVFASLQRAE